MAFLIWLALSDQSLGHTNTYEAADFGRSGLPMIMPKSDELSRHFRPGLRITNYKKRLVITFDVEAEVVSIIGIFYGGQDYETILQDSRDDESAKH